MTNTKTDDALHVRANRHLRTELWSLPLRDKVLLAALHVALADHDDPRKRADVLDLLGQVDRVELS